MVADIDGHGSAFAATLVRTIKPDEGRVQFPTYALDVTWDEFMNEGIFVLFEKLGIKGARMGGAFNPKADPEYERSEALLDRYMNWAKKHNVTVMLTLGDGDSMYFDCAHPHTYRRKGSLPCAAIVVVTAQAA